MAESGENQSFDVLDDQELRSIVESSLEPLGTIKRVLIVHPDYSRHDYSHRLIPLIYDYLLSRGLETFDALNAG